MNNQSNPTPQLAQQPGFVQRIIATFLHGNLSVMLIIIALLAGMVSLMVTPREEEPQIVVPLADVFVSVPGASAREVERKVATRLEKLLYQIDGVEYVYSMSMPDQCVVTVRFYVGEDREDSLIKLHNKIITNQDSVPDIVAGWVIKPLEIDDVPVVGITLYATDSRYSDVDLKRIAQELEIRLQAVKNTGRTYIYGGRSMQVNVAIDPEKLSARRLSIDHLARSLLAANVNLPAGAFQQLDQEILVDAGEVLTEMQQVADLVVGVYNSKPVYLRDIAEVKLKPEEVASYTSFGFGPASEFEWNGQEANAGRIRGRYAAVSIGIAKKKGSNAVWVSRDVQSELDRLAPMLIPDGVQYRITRDYGKTANDKVNELVEALVVAIIIVVGLLSLVMGWREGLIVATAVPITFALTLLINYLAGYTINRVTLFALILALGLVVDDPIVDVENIYRHFKMRLQKPLDAVITAVNEVRPPIILATLAVIVSFIPLFFITGMMGPYMRPMALNVPLAMLMSMVVAFTITPWMSYHVLKGSYEKHNGGKGDDSDGGEYDLHQSLVYRVYAALVRPLLESNGKAWLLLIITMFLFVGSCLLVVTRAVPLKMLPFDNKNEFQVIVDMDEGTTLERTAAAVDAIADYLQRVSEVTDLITYVGTAGPMDFNGLVRHYYLREGSNVGEIRVNLIDKDHRLQQSNEIGLRLRHNLKAIADQYGANIKLVQLPPGPPVIATLTVEVYGKPFHDYDELLTVARVIEDRFNREPGVVDVDSVIESEQRKLVFVTDKEKAALAGLTTAELAGNLKAALAGADITPLHDSDEVNSLPIHIRLPRTVRSDVGKLASLYVAGRDGGMIQLGELGRFVEVTSDQTIYHKNLRSVAYVFAETAGRTPAEAIIDMYSDLTPGGADSEIPADFEVAWAGEGEWKITVDVFRDLGIAFAAACIGIYILLVYETSSYFMPLVLMISIPLTIIGIMPGFWILNLLCNHQIGPAGHSFDNPVFFTATAMIGMIALSGISVRNAILLIDFIHTAMRSGADLKQAILDSGAVRFRPIFLTAGTAMLAAVPITLDPIFSGLAWSLIFGLFVSTAFTLLVIPVVYWLIYRRVDVAHHN